MVARPNPLIKDIYNGQDYTKNFIWAMVFTHKSSIIRGIGENDEIRLLYEENND
ncbi:hypothetical protein APP_02040 [Aeribacillus pallidus]|nr:hypothetical protein APP_02040 [Aeribacillus pallidus]